MTGSGKNRSIRETVRWQESHTVEHGLGDRAFDQTNISVSFAIPSDAQVTTLDNPHDRIYWSLQAKARSIGVDYSAVFEVPVFAAAADLVQLFDDTRWEGNADEDWAQPFKRIDEPVLLEPLAGGGVLDSQVRVEPYSLHGKEFYFPPARNKTAAIGLTVFTALWTGVLALIIHFGAPPLFPVVFDLFNVLLVLCVVDLWLGSTRTLIDPHGVTVSRRYIGVGSTHSVPSADIEGIELKIGMQNNRTPYYDIQLCLRGGKTRRVGPSIREKREAEWLVDAMRESLGRTTHVAAV